MAQLTLLTCTKVVLIRFSETMNPSLAINVCGRSVQGDYVDKVNWTEVHLKIKTVPEGIEVVVFHQRLSAINRFHWLKLTKKSDSR